jgi:quercetin 2,3-dioxygenase
VREPIAARGPFVMNTAEELNAGFAEFRAQGEKFGL